MLINNPIRYKYFKIYPVYNNGVYRCIITRHRFEVWTPYTRLGCAHAVKYAKKCADRYAITRGLDKPMKICYNANEVN